MTKKIVARHHFEQEDDFCQISIHALPSGFPPHRHDYVEIVIILAGSAVHLINRQPYPVGSGDVYVLQGNQEHGFMEASGDFRVCNVMYRPQRVGFPTARLRQLPGYQALFVLEPVHRLHREFKGQLRLDEARLREALAQVQRLRLEMEHRAPGYDCIGQAYLLELIVFLARIYSSAADSSRTGLLRFGQAVAWMEENYVLTASVKDLARRAAMSERHFLRMFRRSFGVSPVEHLIRLRLRHAERLLQSGRHTVAETAYASGFNDSNYFARQFRRATGMSPRAYRCRGSRRPPPG